jgi:hypothetical protein
MAYEIILNRSGVYRLLLEEYPEGVYMYAFKDADSPGPAVDYLQPDLAIAMDACKEDYGVTLSDWRVVPDEGWHDQ